jgi:hypothetical protein
MARSPYDRNDINDRSLLFCRIGRFGRAVCRLPHFGGPSTGFLQPRSRKASFSQATQRSLYL